MDTNKHKHLVPKPPFLLTACLLFLATVLVHAVLVGLGLAKPIFPTLIPRPEEKITITMTENYTGGDIVTRVRVSSSRPGLVISENPDTDDCTITDKLVIFFGGTLNQYQFMVNPVLSEGEGFGEKVSVADGMGFTFKTEGRTTFQVAKVGDQVCWSMSPSSP